MELFCEKVFGNYLISQKLSIIDVWNAPRSNQVLVKTEK